MNAAINTSFKQSGAKLRKQRWAQLKMRHAPLLIVCSRSRTVKPDSFKGKRRGKREPAVGVSEALRDAW